MSGWGTLTYENGDEYIGKFLYGQKHGEGELVIKGARTRETWILGKKKVVPQRRRTEANFAAD